MDFRGVAIGIVFFFQSTFGIVGNVSFLSYYLLHYCTAQKLMTKDVILTHLFTANSLIIVSKGALETMQAFEMKWFINYFGCKLFLFIQRLGRSMSVGTTCVLSIFQAITISPSVSRWKDLKLKAAKYIGLFISLCWVLCMGINMIFPVYAYATESSKNITLKSNLKYCSTSGYNEVVRSLYTAFCVFPEILLSVIITWMGGAMVITLYRHKQRVQHIRSTYVSNITSPETRASRSIVVLVFTFLGFYALSSILQGWIALVYNSGWWLMNITAVISMGFPTLGPFIMSHNSTLFKFHLFCMRKQNIT